MTRFLNVSPRLPVEDLNRTIAFYVGVLGFQAGDPWPEENPTFVLMSRDEVTLQFYVPEPPTPTGHGTISIEVDDAMAVHAAVKGKVKMLWGPEVYWYGRREFSFRDPDGYAVIVSEETEAEADC